jgi:arginase family enzyme
MLTSVRVLNFDNSVVRQNKLIERFKPIIIDLMDLGPRCRLYSNEKTASEVSERIDPGSGDSITFLGSGDFHHITSLLLDKFSEEISVISFDDHPDWDILPPRIGCGSWVTRVLGKDNVKKVILIGASSGDISPSLFRMGNYDSLKGDRLEIYPYQHKPTKVFFKKIPENISADVKSGLLYDEIHWQELKTKNIAEFFLHILRRLPAKKVYVTIDKDCLKAPYSLTNWAGGHLELDELLLMLKFIKENTEIVGLDITGDYSPVKTEGFIRTAITAMNHPRDVSAKDRPQSLIDSVNEAANIRILELLKQ